VKHASVLSYMHRDTLYVDENTFHCVCTYVKAGVALHSVFFSPTQVDNL